VLANPGQDADPNRAVEEFDRPRVGDDVKFAVLKGKVAALGRPHPGWKPGDVDVGDEAAGGLDPVAAGIGDKHRGGGGGSSRCSDGVMSAAILPLSCSISTPRGFSPKSKILSFVSNRSP
jgi:hypothetical protein